MANVFDDKFAAWPERYYCLIDGKMEHICFPTTQFGFNRDSLSVWAQRLQIQKRQAEEKRKQDQHQKEEEEEHHTQATQECLVDGCYNPQLAHLEQPLCDSCTQRKSTSVPYPGRG
eukprot:m.53348 g.53348  ORF g.53348 m.53348 type:complete len:116 (-) comp18384_c0_seq1:23-370(-)